VQLHGSAFARLLLRLAGWRVRFDGLPSGQGVIVVYPHTSNWDFIVGILAKWSIGISVHFWAKDSLFRWPVFGPWLRRLGGIPVDRSAPQGIVGDMARRLRAARDEGRFMWLALTPEGTRGYRDSWKSGFYQVATQSQMPLGLVYFDYAERCVGVNHFIALCGDVRQDMQAIAAYLQPRRGRHPELAAPVRLKD